MPESDRQKWNLKYQQTAQSGTPLAMEVLRENRHLLPATGSALDLACGPAGNAWLIAKQGLDTQAWDISDQIIQQLRNAPFAAIHRDVVTQPPEADRFDVITVGHFLHRAICPAISQALKPGGLLFYQTWSQKRVSDRGPRNPNYRLTPGELLNLFPSLTPVAYREEGNLGTTDSGFRDKAWLIAQQQ